MAKPDFRNNLTMIAGCLTAVFLVLTVIVVGLSWGTQQALKRQNYDDNGLAAIQLRIHFERLVSELKGLEIAPQAYDLDQALLTYDILYERVKTLPTRPPYPEFLDDEITTLLAKTHDDFAAFAPAFDAAASDGDAAGLIGMHTAIEALRPAFERIASRSTQLAAAFRGQKRRDSLDSLRVLVVAVAGLMISSAVFVVLMWRGMRIEKMQIRELAKARDEALRASRAKSEFLAHMSHDLRTPLNAIIGFSDMIRSEAFGPLGQRYVEYATIVKAAGEHLLHLIGELLDLSRIEANKAEFHLQPASLAATVADCVPLVEGRAASKTIALHIEGDTPTVRFRIDSGKVRQMVLNLLDNAVKFCPNGSSITVETADHSEGGAAITVRDTGPGIPESLVAHVLEPFAQVQTGSSMIAQDGSGLGLPIVKGLIEKHGGRIEIDSATGRGTTIRLVFPAALRTTEPIDDADDPSPLSASG